MKTYLNLTVCGPTISKFASGTTASY